ncbi:MAG: serine/threonine protein kinase [Polyangiaceae bacterium]|nr:serine/threonine protein kinase [Polyangiaceae bacterium]
MAHPRRPILLSPGDVLSERYRVSRLLGEGGIALVYVAYDMVLQRTVAVKTLRPNVALSRRAQLRLEREARAAVHLQGRHVARIYDVRRLRNGSPYMVMEYLEGHDLRVELRRRSVLPAHEAVDYVLQSCAAMGEAHAAGIVHRDLKPANLLLCDARGERIVKVLDFGIAKDLGPVDSVLTRTGHRLGTPRYMAPEQVLAARNVDGRVDIWALGVILYECLTGEYAFHVAGFADSVQAIVRAEPRSIHSWGVAVSEGLAAVVHRALGKAPGDRYPSIEAFATALLPHRFPVDPGVSSVRRQTSIDGAPRTGPVVVQVQAPPMPLPDSGHAAQEHLATAVDRIAVESQSASTHDAQAAMPLPAAPSRLPCAEPRPVDAQRTPLRGPANGLAWCVFAAVAVLVFFAIASSVVWVATSH